MSRPIIICDQLSKYYNLGVSRDKQLHVSPPSLREAITDKLHAVRSVFKGQQRETGRSKGGFWAIKDISFTVNRGDVVGIVGRNGAGKSTLLKILSRIVEPTRGTARLRGRLASLLEIGTGFHPELSGRENIYLSGIILGMRKAEIARKFDDIVAFSEIEKFLDTPVKRYSSGMYVRLAFAVAAHLEPEILVVDEVLAVGDYSFQKKCLGKMHDVASNEGRTILFVSHNIASLSQLCNRGVLLEKGVLTMIGPIAEVTETYLMSSAKGHENGQVRFLVEPHRYLQWLSAELLHEDGTVGSDFSCDEPIKVRLTLVIRKPMTTILVEFSVDTHDGIRVLFGDSRDTDPTIVERLGVGVHTFDIQIHPRILAPKPYTISLSAYKQFYDGSGNECDFRSSCVDFTLHDLTSVQQHRHGLVGIMLPWEHQYHDGAKSIVGT